jgi:hypothetical protein
MSIYRGPVFAHSTIRRDYIYVLEKDSVVFSKSIHTFRADGFCSNFLSISASTLNCIIKIRNGAASKQNGSDFSVYGRENEKILRTITFSTPANRKYM